MKLYLYAINISLVMITSTTFPMYRLVKYFAVSALPIAGLINTKNSFGEYNNREKILFNDKIHSLGKKTDKWVKNIIRECNVESIPTLQFPGTNSYLFAMYADRAMIMSEATNNSIEDVLNKKNIAAEEQKELNGKAFAVKHEVGHYIRQDTFYRNCASLLIPSTIQAITSTFGYACTKVCGIKAPRTKIASISRGSLLMLSLLLKDRAATIASIAYNRHQEKQADQFALEHASADEISAAIDFFRVLEVDFLLSYVKDHPNCTVGQVWWGHFFLEGKHPYPADRAIMAEEFLKQLELKKSID